MRYFIIVHIKKKDFPFQQHRIFATYTCVRPSNTLAFPSILRKLLITKLQSVASFMFRGKGVR